MTDRPGPHRTVHPPSTLSLRSGLARLVVLLSACLLVLALAPWTDASASPSSVQGQEWWIGRLGLEIKGSPVGGAWQFTRGAGVTVAVIDQGVDASVPDLRGALVPGFTVGGSGSPTTVHDSEGHGTQMAAYIAGRGTGPGVLGVAPQAKVLPVYLAGADDSGATVQALNRLAAMADPPQVVNMSYGLPQDCSPALQQAVAGAIAKGMMLVASAGNDGNSSNSSQFPSNCKGVIAVGAFDENGLPWDRTQRQPYVAIGGPGVQTVCYDKQLLVGTCDGTSNAAAIVSGELALLRAHWPSMSSRQLVAKLLHATSPAYRGPGYGTSNNVLGFGIGVVNRALRQSVPADASNPVYDGLATVTPSSAPTSARSSLDFPSSSAAPTGRHTVDFPGTASGSGGGSGHTGLIVGIVVAVVVIGAAGVFVATRRRSRGARV